MSGHEDMFICDKCQKSFAKKKTLSGHTSFRHGKKRNKVNRNVYFNSNDCCLLTMAEDCYLCFVGAHVNIRFNCQ